MTTDVKDQAAAERRLWDEIERHQTGMLGLVGEKSHFQPMTAFLERDRHQIWFFTRNDTDLVHQVGVLHPAMFVFQLRDIQACIGGEITIDHDAERIRKYWNAVVSAWYPEGREDPHLTLLRMDCDDAQVWISQGAMKFAWEIARANATKTAPKLGGRASLDFH